MQLISTVCLDEIVKCFAGLKREQKMNEKSEKLTRQVFKAWC